MKDLEKELEKQKKQEKPSNRKNIEKDIQSLSDLKKELILVTPKSFSKYQTLLQLLKGKIEGFTWKNSDPRDRLVIFTERIRTLEFLRENLQADLKLKEKQIAILHGSMDDQQQQEIVGAFGSEDSPIRLLLASDVAAEGINLHFFSRRLIHFDIPWSLMVFQQRNGRVDRYGQTRSPYILYLFTKPENEMAQGDSRILEVLVDKEKEAHENIGDPQILMNVYDQDKEEEKTAQSMEKGEDAETFAASLKVPDFNPLLGILGLQESPSESTESTTPLDPDDQVARSPSLFSDDFIYFREAIQFLHTQMKIGEEWDEKKKQVLFRPGKEALRYRFQFLPPEIIPKDYEFVLTTDRDAIEEEIALCRKTEDRWPQRQLLWENHPLMEWTNDKLLAAFGRHEAPVLQLEDKLEKKEVIFLISGLIPNRKGHPVLNPWFGVMFQSGEFTKLEDFDKILERLDLQPGTLPNLQKPFQEKKLKEMLGIALEKTRSKMTLLQKEYSKKTKTRLKKEQDELEALKTKKQNQATKLTHKKEQKLREIEEVFTTTEKWIEDTLKIEEEPYLKVIAILMGKTMIE